MEFENKRSLLEYLGKNPKDNKLVDRMMLRGEVYMENGMYYLVEEDVDALKRENEELKRKLEEKSDQPNAKNFEDTAEIIKLRDRIRELEEEKEALKRIEKFDTNPDELEELRINCEYWENKAKEYGRYCSDIMDICYEKVKSALGNKYTETKESFKEGIGNLLKQPNID